MRSSDTLGCDLRDASGRELAGRSIEVAGCETHVVEGGHGPSLLLLHGYGDSCAGWRRLVPGLTRRFRVIAIDLPGFGRSQGPPADVDLLDHYSAFFPELARRLRTSRTAVIGHSLGGAVALRIALERPALVSRLALIAPAGLGQAPPWWWHAIAGTYVNWQAMLRLPNPLAKVVIRNTMRSFLRQRLIWDARKLEHLVEEFVEVHGGRRQLTRLFERGRSLIRGYDGRLLGQAREQLGVPVCVIWGSQDRLAEPAHGYEFADAVPHAELHMLERCGHYPQMEHPLQVAGVLQEFLAGREQLRKAA